MRVLMTVASGMLGSEIMGSDQENNVFPSLLIHISVGVCVAHSDSVLVKVRAALGGVGSGLGGSVGVSDQWMGIWR